MTDQFRTDVSFSNEVRFHYGKTFPFEPIWVESGSLFSIKDGSVSQIKEHGHATLRLRLQLSMQV
jgi:hypothetical protein